MHDFLACTAEGEVRVDRVDTPYDTMDDETRDSDTASIDIDRILGEK